MVRCHNQESEAILDQQPQHFIQTGSTKWLSNTSHEMEVTVASRDEEKMSFLSSVDDGEDREKCEGRSSGQYEYKNRCTKMKSSETSEKCDSKSGFVDCRRRKLADHKSGSSSFLSVFFSDLFVRKSRKGEESVVFSFLLALFVVVNVVFVLDCFSGVSAGPVVLGRQHSVFQLSPSARNIRHLPCVSRRTKEEGICMFAIDCLKANGTHLGTCIDRFYFGSCCQVPDAVAPEPIEDNRIEDNTIFGQPIRTEPIPEKFNDLENSLNSLPSSTNKIETTAYVGSTQGYHKNTATSQRPVSETQKATVGQKPSSVSQKPSTASQKPSTASQKPSTASQKPSTASQKPSTASQKPSTASQKPSTASQRPTSFKPNFSSQKPAVSSNTPFSTQSTAGTSQKQGASSGKPNTSYQSSSGTTERPSTSAYKPSTAQNTLSDSQKLGEASQRPTINIQKPSYTAVKQNYTTSAPKRPTTKPSEVTKRPSTSAATTITKKPITTGYVINNTKYTTKLPANASAVVQTVDRTETNNKEKPQLLMPSLKPTRHNVTNTTYSPNQTTTFRPFFLPSRSTTERSTTTTTETSIFPSVQTTVYINNQLFNVTKHDTVIETKKPSVTKLPERTTEIPFRISTFQTIQSNKETATKKPTTVNIETKKPTPKPQKPVSDIPFGTRLPSSTVSPTKVSTLYNKPSTGTTASVVNNQSTSSYSTTQTTQTQKPIQKPKPTQKPIQRPASNTTVTSRPTIQRPQNSTLSNRRPTTSKPTTVHIRRPTTTEKPVILRTNLTDTTITQKPITTIVYRPSFNSTASSSKPTFLTQKPSQTTATIQRTTTTQKPSTAQKPTLEQKPTTTEQKPTTGATKKPYISVTKPIQETQKVTTETPVKTTQKIATTTKKVILESTTVRAETKPSRVTEKPSPQSTASVTTASQSTSTATTTVSKPSTSSKPSPTSGKPISSTVEDKKPTPPSSTVQATTQKPVKVSTISTLANEVDAIVSNKPIAGVERPISSTTEKIGLVTWTNYAETPVTTSSIVNTTLKEEEWSPVNPPDGWVLLPTVTTSDNATSQTLKPTTIASTERPAPATTATGTKKPETTPATNTTKPIFTVQVTTRPSNASSTLENDVNVEFSTFMSVSGGPTTEKTVPSTVSSTAGDGNATETSTDVGTTVFDTTDVTGFDNETSTDMPTNTTQESAGATDKSTVSPIEGITSSVSPMPSTDNINMSDYKDVCGRRLWPEARVVGGSRSPFGRWPWQVSLRQWRASTYLHKCGAALLSDSWAITAAHCVDSVPPSDLLLRLGEHDLASEEEPYGFQERRVQIVASHPQFDPRTFEYDLALLRFYEPVTFQPNILPVCVPTTDEGFVGKTAYVTGWGRLYEDGPLPSVLQEVSVPVLENEACEGMYRSAGYIEHIPHIFICAGWKKGGFDSCEGDSGGPMVLQRDDKRFLLAGVISWGIGCAEPNQPGVYTRISEFRDWINQILQF